MSLFVYAVVSAGSRVGGRGIAGEPLRVVTSGRLAAVVGDARAPRQASPARLVAYDRVLQRLATRAVAIVPARFGTLVADEAELLFVLRARDRSLHRTLAHVRHRAQMTVRLVVEGSHDAARVTRTAAAGARRVSSGTAYLRARADDAARERNLPELLPLRAAVRRWIRDEHVERHGRLATIHHLIPRASTGKYDRALERAAREHGVPVAVSGPWVPYAFAGAEGGFGA